MSAAQRGTDGTCSNLRHPWRALAWYVLDVSRTPPPSPGLPSEHPFEVTATLPSKGGAGEAPVADPSTATWDRYELLELLGRGGMGSVYKARDRRLGRTLAIKFILGANPNLTMRFLREARAQARIDHPNVCRVYEIGEVEGRPYIALQFVGGEPLSKAVARMSLDEKVAVMREVAAAIQEAHRLGIVHRDLKPSNIMVERTEDGRWLPVVMDFGLARETTLEAGITESGTLLGTPAYMSPEQARGDVHAIDRRSDVYSLGATLYELLTGRPPFSSASLAEMLAQVIHDEPPAPRSLAPSLPVDLETIALQCLAKDPAQRYPSARALADDLGRYLAGEPILGRRLSLWQRVRLHARRQRALVILGAWSLAIILAVGAFGLRTWLVSRSERARAAERTRLAGRLGQDAKEIEMTLQLAYQQPLHNTVSDRERVRVRMQAIAATRHDLGAFGDALIHDALGRGHLALHEWRQAADELEHAEHAGTAGRPMPGLHAARGRALGELYHRALEEVRLAADKEWLIQQQRELAQRYLTPALDELEQSRASGEDTELLDALIALYRRDFATAEKHAHAVAKRSPGLAEARKLAAEAAYAAAVESFDHGDYAAARPGLERAAALYTEASDIARSDGSLYKAAAQTWLQLAELAFIEGRPPVEPLERARGLLDERALRAEPDDASAYITKAHVLLRWYRIPPSNNQDVDRLLQLDDIAQAATTAVKLDPQDAQAWIALGNADVYRGMYERSQGAPWLGSAIDELGRALAIEPNNPRAHNALGTAHRWLGTSLRLAGGDPRPEFRAALRSYERATELDPQYDSACINQIELYVSIAEYENASGDDPRPAIDSARRVGQHCLVINPKSFYAREHLARAELTLADHLVETGDDPAEALAHARPYIDGNENLHPGYLASHYFRLFAARVEAAFQVRQGADPTSAITVGRIALTEALQRAPDSALSYVEAARLELVEAAWKAHTGREASASLTEARVLAEEAIKLDPQLANAQLTAAEVRLQITKAQPSPTVIKAGMDHVKKALALNPRLRKAQEVGAELSRLSAP